MKYLSKKINFLTDDFGIRKISIKKFFDYLIIFFSIFLGLYLNWEIFYVIFFTFIIWQILYPLPRVVLSVISLLLLFLLPFAFYFKGLGDTENLAIFAYGFLFLTVVMAIIEYGRKENDGRK